ncbi:molybdopterin-synthase adenylyltransferase MoeB [Micrococcoides hystricis]|uniref:Molybdopterin-synthase adenylyltransferase MoeB n=1 Tax=Micrococcoides hystricis TaxID=1572761 RepID=A0ABV6PAR8_9MICC
MSEELRARIEALEPLAELGPELTPEETARYARHLSLPGFGVTAQRRLKAAKVFVVGAGGLGSPVLQYLAAAGVGTIGLVDDDVVEVTNLQRQVIHRTENIGKLKVDSAAEAVKAVNPHVQVETYTERLSAQNILDIISKYDIVVDGTDNFGTRYLVNDACELTGTPLVWGTIFRFAAQLSVFYPGVGPTLRDLFPEIPDPSSVPSCAEGGVLGVLPGLVGTAMATEAIKLLAGIGEPAIGRVLIYDAWKMSWNTLNLLPDPDREPVRDLSEAAFVCAANPTEGADDPAALRNESGLQVIPEQLADELTKPGRVLIDVRDDWERDVVLIPEAIHVPLARIQDRNWDAVTEALEAHGIKPELVETVVLHCKAGGRSGQAQQILNQAGVEGQHPQTKNLSGGVLAWAEKYAPEAPSY